MYVSDFIRQKMHVYKSEVYKMFRSFGRIMKFIIPRDYGLMTYFVNFR